MAVEYRLSGGQFNASGNGSLGGQRSDTLITTDTIENLFDNISRAEALVGRTEYRCFYVFNTGGGHISGAIVEIKTNPLFTTLSVGLDPIGKGDGRNDGVATTIATEDTTPTGVKFFSEDILSDSPFDTVKLPLGLLKSGEGVAVWLKRVTEQATAQTITLTIDVVHDAVTLPAEDVDDGIAIGELIAVTVTATGAFKIGTARIGFSDIGSP